MNKFIELNHVILHVSDVAFDISSLKILSVDFTCCEKESGKTFEENLTLNYVQGGQRHNLRRT